MRVGTAGVASLLVELIGVTAQFWVGWMGEGGLRGKSGAGDL